MIDGGVASQPRDGRIRGTHARSIPHDSRQQHCAQEEERREIDKRVEQQHRDQLRMYLRGTGEGTARGRTTLGGSIMVCGDGKTGGVLAQHVKRKGSAD